MSTLVHSFKRFVKRFHQIARHLSAKYGLLILMLAIWELSGRLESVDQKFVPSLSTTLAAVGDLWERAFLFTHIMVSLGYILGRVFPSASDALEPLLRVFGLINPYCLFPLFVVFFGSGETPKIAVLAWVSLWPIFFSTLAGVRNVDPILIKTGQSMTAGKIATFWKIILPAAAPQIFSGLRIGVEMSFFILIAAEMTGATAGLGWIIHSAGALYQVPRIYAAGLCVVVLGVLINRFLVFLKNGFFFWKDSIIAGSASFASGPANGGLAPSPGPEAGGSKISGGVIAVVITIFVIILAVGIHQIILAELRLNDPTIIPEYRIWTE